MRLIREIYVPRRTHAVKWIAGDCIRQRGSLGKPTTIMYSARLFNHTCLYWTWRLVEEEQKHVLTWSSKVQFIENLGLS